jgi:cobalt/nickel transport system permease protein
MHIPDGFVSVPVVLATGMGSAGAIALALKQSRSAYGMKQGPILGLTTAFVFAAQMINFPVAGGTSGHLLGATLAAVLTGNPWAGTLSIATVLLIQAVMFADGGITALGANILNMAVIGVWTGWGLTQVIQRLLGGSRQRLPLAAGIAAGVSVVAAAIACAIELVLSGTADFALVLPAMTGIHILIGVGEGIITGGVLGYLMVARPDLLPGSQPRLQRWQGLAIGICLIAGLLSLVASSWPDGLEKVAEDLGFINLAEEVRVPVATPFADYSIEGLGPLGTTITGLLGCVACFGTAFGITKLVSSKPSEEV